MKPYHSRYIANPNLLNPKPPPRIVGIVFRGEPHFDALFFLNAGKHRYVKFFITQSGNISGATLKGGFSYNLNTDKHISFVGIVPRQFPRMKSRS